MHQLVDPLEAQAGHTDVVRVGVGQPQGVAAMCPEFSNRALSLTNRPPVVHRELIVDGIGDTDRILEA